MPRHIILKHFKKKNPAYNLCKGSISSPASSAWTLSEASSRLSCLIHAGLSPSSPDQPFYRIIIDRKSGPAERGTFPSWFSIWHWDGQQTTLFHGEAWRSIIHTDLRWLQFSCIFSGAEEEKPHHVLLHCNNFPSRTLPYHRFYLDEQRESTDLFLEA